MVRRIMVLLAVPALICMFCVVPAAAQKDDVKATVPKAAAGEDPAAGPIKQLLVDHARAFEAKNLDVVTGMYADDAILIGTTPNQRWIGKEAIRKAHQEFFQTFDKETIAYVWQTIRVAGDMAWMAADCNVTSVLEGTTDEFPLNWTAVLAKKDGKWQFVLSHFSSPAFGEGLVGEPDEDEGEADQEAADTEKED
ncbi:MAG: nuclear transport factor 2 family protein [Desulfomonilaceae bacterium]|nr:nuclear transport factor 2 family protein [Desulfomonilaceae bacterium]